MRRLLLVFVASGLMLAMGSSARADEAQFYLSTNESGGTIPADAVQVTVQTDSGGATITFTALSVGSTQYYLGRVLFNLSSGSFSSTGSSITPAHSPGINAPPPTGSLDGFGSMTDLITWAPNDSETSVIIQVDGTYASAWNVLTKTSAGYDAAASVGTSSTGGSSNDNHSVAGYYTPEPASMVLFGSGLLIVGFFVRRKKFAV